MKTYTIELQHLRAMSHSHGMVQARVDATVSSLPARDAGDATSTLSLNVENARVLLLLLKAQLAEIDARKGRSQR